MGIRINNSFQPPKPSPIRYTQDTIVDKEVTKLEKIKTMLAGPNTNMGKNLCLVFLLDIYFAIDKI
jgi:hypothetical protein